MQRELWVLFVVVVLICWFLLFNVHSIITIADRGDWDIALFGGVEKYHYSGAVCEGKSLILLVFGREGYTSLAFYAFCYGKIRK